MRSATVGDGHARRAVRRSEARLARALVLGFALIGTACASTSADAGFDDVRNEVKTRLGKRVSWNSGGSPRGVAAQEVDRILARPLTAEDAVQVALLENRALQARYAELGVAQADLVQAGLLSNPVLGLGLRFPAGGGPTEIDGTFVTDFLRILFSPLRLRAASAEVEAAKLQVTGSVLELAGQTRETFLDYQASEQLAELWEEVVQSTAGSYEAAKALHEAGNITDLDLGRERALHDASRVELADARLAAADARERLNVLMGVWGDRTGWTAPPRLPPVPAETVELDDLEARAVAASLDLARSRRQIESRAYALGSTDVTRLFSGESNVGIGAEREEEWEVGPTIEVPLPLFDQGQGRVANAQAVLRRELDAYHALAVEVRAAARAAAQAFLSARSKAIFYRDEVLPLRTRLVNAAQLQFNAMQIGVFELLQEKERQIRAGQRFVDAQREYWIARAELQQLLDGKLPRRRAIRAPIGDEETGRDRLEED